MNTSFRKIAIIVFIALGVGILIISLMFYQSTLAYKNTSYWVKHTRIVIDEAEQVASLSKDIQLESNAFYVIGDSSFLSTFTKAKRNITHHLATLKDLTTDSPLQEQRIHFLETAIDKLIAFSEAANHTRSTNSTNISKVTEIFFQRKTLRTEIGRNIDAIRNEENRLLRIREAANNKSAAATETILYLLIGFVFVLLLTGFYLVFHYFKKQKKQKTN